MSYDMIVPLPMDSRANSIDALSKNLSERDPGTYEIIGAAIEVHKQLGKTLATSFCADFICFNSIVVELKALAVMSGAEKAQLINYLKATRFKVGLLLNFGARSLQHRRLVF
jgi:PD-(D/E)XK nuclease superfamily protein